MRSLQTLSRVKLIMDDDGVELSRELGMLTQLRNLGLNYVKKEQGSALFASINEVKNLEKLHIQTIGVEVNVCILFHPCLCFESFTYEGSSISYQSGFDNSKICYIQIYITLAGKNSKIKELISFPKCFIQCEIFCRLHDSQHLREAKLRTQTTERN